MLQLLETGKAFYLLEAICLLGIITRMITRHLYKRLVKESTNLTLTKNKSLRELKLRAENTYRMNQGLRDSSAWLERQLYELKQGGMTLHSWNNLSGQWTWLCLLVGGVGAFFSYWYRLDTYYMVLYGGGAVLLSMFMMLFDSGAAAYREQLVVTLQDYLENIMCPRLARNLPIDSAKIDPVRTDGRDAEREGKPEKSEARNVSRLSERQTGGRNGIGGARKTPIRGGKRPPAVEAATATAATNVAEHEGENRREIDYIRHSLEQIAASRERNRGDDENWLKDLGPEEVQLIGDILKQYLV